MGMVPTMGVGVSPIIGYLQPGYIRRKEERPARLPIGCAVEDAHSHQIEGCRPKNLFFSLLFLPASLAKKGEKKDLSATWQPPLGSGKRLH